MPATTAGAAKVTASTAIQGFSWVSAGRLMRRMDFLKEQVAESRNVAATTADAEGRERLLTFIVVIEAKIMRLGKGTKNGAS